MFDEKYMKVLGLTKKEQRVIAFLKNVANTSIASLHKQTKIPRMTLYHALASLKERGLIHSIVIGKRRFWNLNAKDILCKKFLDISNSFIDNDKFYNSFDKTEFIIVKGLDNLYEIWKEMIKSNKNGRILGIQPTSSLTDALKKTDFNPKYSSMLCIGPCDSIS